MLTRYAVADRSYFDPLPRLEFADGDQRYPLSDLIGTSRRLVDETGAATDAYPLDAFGRYTGGWASPTPNPYRFGAAWGYLTDAPWLRAAPVGRAATGPSLAASSSRTR